MLTITHEASVSLKGKAGQYLLAARATAHMAKIMDTVLSDIDGRAKQIKRDQQRSGKLHFAARVSLLRARISTHYFVSWRVREVARLEGYSYNLSVGIWS